MSINVIIYVPFVQMVLVQIYTITLCVGVAGCG